MPDERLCRNCGEAVPENETFCPNCAFIYIPSKTKARSNPAPSKLPKIKARIFESSGGRKLKSDAWIWVQKIGVLVLILCSLRLISPVWNFFTGDGLIQKGFMKILNVFFWLLIEVFWFTIPCLLPPIAAYVFISTLSRNRIIRFLSGIGSVYLFYVFSGDISFSFEAAVNLFQMAFQIYFLIILITPDVLKSSVSALASAIGSVIIYVLPDAPGPLDDIGVICVMTTMFIYINLLALGVKQVANSDWLAIFVKKVTNGFWGRYVFRKDE